MYGGATLPPNGDYYPGATNLTPYGACALPAKAQGLGGRRARQTNLLAFITCLSVPCAIFAAIFALQSFSMHHTDPSTVSAFVLLIGLLVLGMGVLAAYLWLCPGKLSLDPKWYSFLFVTSAVAWILGCALGNQNFNENTVHYFDLMDLDTYRDLDPSATSGNMVMDAGKIEFSKGSYVEVSMSMGFKNLDVYCVAPIVSRAKQEGYGAQNRSSTAAAPGDANVTTSGANRTSLVGAAAAARATPRYDFWAVGTNCCSGQFPDFHCGDFANPLARSGLRLIADDKRPYFRLALMQAEAAFRVKAQHPVFVYWMRNPEVEVASYMVAASKFFISGIVIFIAVQLLAVFLATVAFSKFFR